MKIQRVERITITLENVEIRSFARILATMNERDSINRELIPLDRELLSDLLNQIDVT